MKKSLFLPLALFAIAFAQDKNISINGSIGYIRDVYDYDGYGFELKNYPFEGFNFDFGVKGFIPLTDVAKFGGDVSVLYGTISTAIESDELAYSIISLTISPTIRFGQEKTYADIGLHVLEELSRDRTIKISGITHTEKFDPVTDIALFFAGRFNMIGAGLSKVLTNGKETILNARGFIPVTERIEIVPFINYSTPAGSYSLGNTLYFARDSRLQLGIGFDYFL
jgi:hypothetical protein